MALLGRLWPWAMHRYPNRFDSDGLRWVTSRRCPMQLCPLRRQRAALPRRAPRVARRCPRLKPHRLAIPPHPGIAGANPPRPAGHPAAEGGHGGWGWRDGGSHLPRLIALLETKSRPTIPPPCCGTQTRIRDHCLELFRTLQRRLYFLGIAPRPHADRPARASIDGFPLAPCYL